MRRFSAAVCRRLKHYVYLYVDPRDGRPFYVGKGRDNRAFAHLSARGTGNEATASRIAELRREGLRPGIEVLVHGLNDRDAKQVEAAAIDLLGLGNLTNTVSGHGSTERGRIPASEVATLLAPKRARVVPNHKLILILVADRYYHGISAAELYDATRGVWVLDRERARNADYALALHNSIVREVYKIEEWFPCGSTFYPTRDEEFAGTLPSDYRSEFVGRIAPPAVRRRYLYRSLDLPSGARNPIRYMNC